MGVIWVTSCSGTIADLFQASAFTFTCQLFIPTESPELISTSRENLAYGGEPMLVTSFLASRSKYC